MKRSCRKCEHFSNWGDEYLQIMTFVQNGSSERGCEDGGGLNFSGL
jgi:hypothetical protein